MPSTYLNISFKCWNPFIFAEGIFRVPTGFCFLFGLLLEKPVVLLLIYDLFPLTPSLIPPFLLSNVILFLGFQTHLL